MPLPGIKLVSSYPISQAIPGIANINILQYLLLPGIIALYYTTQSTVFIITVVLAS